MVSGSFWKLLRRRVSCSILGMRDNFIETNSKFARENWWLEEDPTSFCDRLSSGVFAVSFREGNKKYIRDVHGKI